MKEKKIKPENIKRANARISMCAAYSKAKSEQKDEKK